MSETARLDPTARQSCMWWTQVTSLLTHSDLIHPPNFLIGERLTLELTLHPGVRILTIIFFSSASFLSDHYYTRVAWQDGTHVYVTWVNRQQNHVIAMFYDISAGTSRKVINHFNIPPTALHFSMMWESLHPSSWNTQISHYYLVSRYMSTKRPMAGLMQWVNLLNKLLMFELFCVCCESSVPLTSDHNASLFSPSPTPTQFS